MKEFCIKAENLSKSFRVIKRSNSTLQILKSSLSQETVKENLQILKGLSCVIPQGEKVALLGRNGCGKTTFLRIIGGIYEKTSGTLEIKGTINMLFKSSFGLNAHIPVADNIFLLAAIQNIEKKVIKDKMDEILKTSGLFDLRFTILKRLSPGQIQRLVLSVFFHTTGDILIFDESLESIDPDFTKICDAYFHRPASSDKTVIMASHQGEVLAKYCTRAIWLDDGRIKMQGKFDEINEAYKRSPAASCQ